MSWVRIWVHLVFSTKNREAVLHKPIREELYSHILENGRKKDIWIESINGFSEHVHCLVSLGREQTISKITQLIKGESSFWLNKNYFTQSKFTWQDDFWAVSVSESHIEKVKNYIKRQDEHHSIKLFSDEIDEFMNKYGWSLVRDK